MAENRSFTDAEREEVDALAERLVELAREAEADLGIDPVEFLERVREMVRPGDSEPCKACGGRRWVFVGDDDHAPDDWPRGYAPCPACGEGDSGP